MSHPLDNPGVLTTVMNRFARQQLPRIFAIQRNLENGSRLTDSGILFLHSMEEEFSLYSSFVKTHPEYKDLYCRAVHIFSDIVDRALENERQSGA